MSEKQFVLYEHKGDYYILKNPRIHLDFIEMLDELVTKCHSLEKENRELNSIKKFAERNGINIFLIDEAFRKCWKDNGKLFEENKYLKKRIKVISEELYCKDRKLEELGVPIECCDKK